MCLSFIFHLLVLFLKKQHYGSGSWKVTVSISCLCDSHNWTKLCSCTYVTCLLLLLPFHVPALSLGWAILSPTEEMISKFLLNSMIAKHILTYLPVVYLEWIAISLTYFYYHLYICKYILASLEYSLPVIILLDSQSLKFILASLWGGEATNGLPDNAG